MATGVVMTHGPFAETKERIGGLFNIEAKDLDHAIEVASKHPTAHLSEHESMPVDAERMA
jgi:hypothetical protein